MERYITDDVLRHGNRLLELEKKLANAYAQEAAAAAENLSGVGLGGIGVVDDEMLFGGKVGPDGGEEGEEEDSAFVMSVFSRPYMVPLNTLANVLNVVVWVCRGGFTDDLGEDFLGLKELGIASEFGLSSLSVPKKLLRNKKGVKPAFVPYVFCFLAFFRPFLSFSLS